MEDFYQFLKSNFSSSITELSKTSFDNSLVENDCMLINLDEMSQKLPKFNSGIKTIFASADALLIRKNGDEFNLFFIEFKNIDFSDNKDRLMSKYILDECIGKMELCHHNCMHVDELSMCSKYLTDRYNVSLRSKPVDSISLIYHFMEYFFDGMSKTKLFNFNKYFILVSRTKIEYNHLKNKNNKNNSIIAPLSFLSRLVPYYYDDVLVLSEKNFSGFLEMLNNS